MITYYRTYYIGFGLGTTLLGLVIFLILQWLQVPSGNLVDWLIGVASFWWLLTIVVVPWNVYFDAKEVIVDAAISKDKQIEFDEKNLDYVKKISRWSLIIALSLHLISAVALYSLAALGISSIGYVSSAATLLLTGLRPSFRAYEYLAMRLAAIREEIKYPREDILELRNRFNQLEIKVKNIDDKFDLSDPDSWIVTQQREWSKIHQDIIHLQDNLAQFKQKNKAEHQHISEQANSAISRLTEDSQFLAQVREIIRFFKSA